MLIASKKSRYDSNKKENGCSSLSEQREWEKEEARDKEISSPPIFRTRDATCVQRKMRGKNELREKWDKYNLSDRERTNTHEVDLFDSFFFCEKRTNCLFQIFKFQWYNQGNEVKINESVSTCNLFLVKFGI